MYRSAKARIEWAASSDEVIIQQLNRWPRPGDAVQLGAYTAKVMTVLHRRVGQVLIMPSTQEIGRADAPSDAST